jgi:hypothetical protein
MMIVLVQIKGDAELLASTDSLAGLVRRIGTRCILSQPIILLADRLEKFDSATRRASLYSNYAAYFIGR